MDAVLNWVAQGALVALAARMLLAASRGLGAAPRYAVWWVALLLVAALPLMSAPSRDEASDTAAVGAAARPSRALLRVPDAPPAATAAFAIMWALWTAGMTGRGWVALASLRRAKRSARPFPAEREARLHHWTAIRTHRRRARLVTSDAVPNAAVLGLGERFIAVAPALLEALDDDQLDRILVHEWAHVQRRDDYALVVQLLVRAAVGWHPALWWMDRQLVLEREAACDETAVGITGSPKAYASCLAALAALGSPRIPSMPAPAADAGSRLATRVHRILGWRGTPPVRRSALVAVLASSVVAAAAWSSGRFPVFEVDTSAPLPSIPRAASRVVPASVLQQPVHIVSASEPTEAARRGPVRRTRWVEPEIARGAAVEADQDAATPRASKRPPSEPPIAARVQPAPPAGVPSGPAGTIAAHPVWIVAGLASGALAPSADATLREHPSRVTPWGAAADTGVAVGRRSQQSAVATAGFFTRVGRKMAGSF